MSGYSKFMKELVTKKRTMDFETIKVSHNCSAIMTSEMITKKEDPGAFTIPCTIGILKFVKALCDLGASINLMPYAIYKQLGLGEPKSTTMRLVMVDRSIKYPGGILYDILVKVDRFIFLDDFVILDSTRKVLVDVESAELMFRVNKDEVTFNVCKSMKHPSDIHVVTTIDVIIEAVATVSHIMCMSEPLEVVLANYDKTKVQGYDEVVVALSGLGEYSKNPLKLDIDLKYRENPSTKPSTEEPPKLELKVLPAHLRYAFLGTKNTLPAIIAANFLEWQVRFLLKVLKMYISYRVDYR
ncbi:uncharacterized protein LOC125807269 [Solanum verrucosum]|uniref:uncharacterized protein LOC125807269 n=1 Tax=Solanum verrucosum TaxID=315347 RepID=UPI0020D1DA45|nr:uncharacterized protein LOC125807269 [Solanum verrucosum]